MLNVKGGNGVIGFFSIVYVIIVRLTPLTNTPLLYSVFTNGVKCSGPSCQQLGRCSGRYLPERVGGGW